MNQNPIIPPAVTLRDKLEQSGHLWWVEAEVADWGVLASANTEAITNRVVTKILDWGIPTTREEVRELLRPLAVQQLDLTRAAVARQMGVAQVEVTTGNHDYITATIFFRDPIRQPFRLYGDPARTFVGTISNWPRFEVANSNVIVYYPRTPNAQPTE